MPGASLSLLKRPFVCCSRCAYRERRLGSSVMRSVLISAFLTFRGLIRSRIALHLEVLALHHQPQVLQRSHSHRLALGKVDRCLWIWLSRVWANWRTALVIVQPETVIAWHRRGFRLFWAWKSRRRIGRPPVPLGCQGPDSDDVTGQSVVGRATHSRRAAEVGSGGFSGYGRKVHGALEPVAVTVVAHLPRQPRSAKSPPPISLSSRLPLADCCLPW